MTYLACYAPHKDDTAALDLGAQLARAEKGRLHALSVVPAGWGTPSTGGADLDFRQWAAQEGELCAREARAVLRTYDGVESSAAWVSARSVPQAVLEQARKQQARLIVAGSGESGPRGFVTVTSKTDRLLHSASVPVAIAPRGYRAPSGSRITRITMAFRDDDATWGLLDRVAGLCRRIDARLRLVTFAIRPRPMVTSAVRDTEQWVYERWLEQARCGLDEATDHLHAEGFTDVEACVLRGRSWGAAMDEVEWTRTEVLVVGSSSTHRLAEVFLGSSAAKILRNSTVPVVVVP